MGSTHIFVSFTRLVAPVTQSGMSVDVSLSIQIKCDCSHIASILLMNTTKVQGLYRINKGFADDDFDTRLLELETLDGGGELLTRKFIVQKIVEMHICDVLLYSFKKKILSQCISPMNILGLHKIHSTCVVESLVLVKSLHQ